MELSAESRFPVLEELRKGGLEYTLFTHRPVFTVAEGVDIMRGIPGQGTKNLFLRDKKGTRFFLVTVCEEKRVDLNALAAQFDAGRLSFASVDSMKHLLSLEPGSVTPLGLLYDSEKTVGAYFDQDLSGDGPIQIHPMKNDATIVVSGRGLISFLTTRGTAVHPIKIPVRSSPD